ncbi:hypothetical protein J6590_018357 [Homalodisca vitripennis]|nr:hypothetical protein J6590_075168 [Homalodisca vitripennis]KAG8312717.1 hypothetical protein J6590_018357 [Homalodisca vitripennis]
MNERCGLRSKAVCRGEPMKVQRRSLRKWRALYGARHNYIWQGVVAVAGGEPVSRWSWKCQRVITGVKTARLVTTLITIKGRCSRSRGLAPGYGDCGKVDASSTIGGACLFREPDSLLDSELVHALPLLYTTVGPVQDEGMCRTKARKAETVAVHAFNDTSQSLIERWRRWMPHVIRGPGRVTDRN